LNSYPAGSSKHYPFLPTQQITNQPHQAQNPEQSSSSSSSSSKLLQQSANQDLANHLADIRKSDSFLLLRISAHADFHTTNTTLSRDGLLVLTDIILDPYLLNLLPRTLLPTSIYIILLAALAWPIAGVAWKYLQTVSTDLLDQANPSNSNSKHKSS
jgi:hypothetical protein